MAAIIKEITFKNIDDGNIHSFSHNNFPLFEFKEYYKNKLLKKLNLTNIKCIVDIIYIDDYKNETDILEKFLNKDDIDIDDILYQYYNKCKKDNLYFYVKINNNNIFSGQCTICYNSSTRLNHYYNCDINNIDSHHGICDHCYNLLKKTPYNLCPICRSSHKI
tara:strand:+ start:5508 stop:5996 length:489 start_codon:yes stop_codon:yes gene_type:complete